MPSADERERSRRFRARRTSGLRRTLVCVTIALLWTAFCAAAFVFTIAASPAPDLNVMWEGPGEPPRFLYLAFPSDAGAEPRAVFVSQAELAGDEWWVADRGFRRQVAAEDFTFRAPHPTRREALIRGLLTEYDLRGEDSRISLLTLEQTQDGRTVLRKHGEGGRERYEYEVLADGSVRPSRWLGLSEAGVGFANAGPGTLVLVVWLTGVAISLLVSIGVILQACICLRR